MASCCWWCQDSCCNIVGAFETAEECEASRLIRPRERFFGETRGLPRRARPQSCPGKIDPGLKARVAYIGSSGGRQHHHHRSHVLWHDDSQVDASVSSECSRVANDADGNVGAPEMTDDASPGGTLPTRPNASPGTSPRAVLRVSPNPSPKVSQKPSARASPRVSPKASPHDSARGHRATPLNSATRSLSARSVDASTATGAASALGHLLHAVMKRQEARHICAVNRVEQRIKKFNDKQPRPLMTLLNSAIKLSHDRGIIESRKMKADAIKQGWAVPCLKNSVRRLNAIVEVILLTRQIHRERTEERLRQAQNNRADAIKFCDKSGSNLEKLGKFRSDPRVALAAVKNTPHALKFATFLTGPSTDVAEHSIEQCPPLLSPIVSDRQNEHYVRGSQNPARLQKMESRVLAQSATRDLEEKVVALAAVERDSMTLKYGGRYRGDKDVVLQAVKHNGLALQFASQSLRRDPDVAFAAVTSKGLALQFVDKALIHDYSITMAACRSNGDALQYAADEFKRDKFVVLASLSVSGLALQYACEDLRMDPHIVRCALDASGGAALPFFCRDKYISQQEKLGLQTYAERQVFELEEHAVQALDCKEVVPYCKTAALLVCSDPKLLQHAGSDLQGDYNVVKAAVEGTGSDPTMLRFAKASAVEKILQENGMLVSYVAEELEDERFALMAVIQDGRAIEKVPERYQTNYEVCKAAVKSNGRALLVLDKSMQVDLDLAEYAVTQDPKVYEEMTISGDPVFEKARHDQKVVLAAVSNCGGNAKVIPDELRANKGIMMAAITHTTVALQYASDTVKDDSEVANLVACSADKSALVYIGKNAALSLVKKDGGLVKYLCDELKDDDDVGVAAVMETKQRCKTGQIAENVVSYLSTGLRLRMNSLLANAAEPENN